MQILIEEVQELRQRVDRLERAVASLEGALKAVAVVAPLMFTLLNIILRLAKLI
jgi:prefoldin subunit 5